MDKDMGSVDGGRGGCVCCKPYISDKLILHVDSGSDKLTTNNDKAMQHIAVYATLIFLVVSALLDATLFHEHPDQMMVLGRDVANVADSLCQVGELLGGGGEGGIVESSKNKLRKNTEYVQVKMVKIVTETTPPHLGHSRA
jgi:hypothetical protein